MLYISLVYLFSFVYWGPKLSKKKKFILACIPFIIINFMRYGYGADYFSYARIYQDVGFRSISQIFDGSSGFEPLYVLVSFLSSKIGLSYHIFAGIMTSFISIIFILWMKDSSKNFEWSVLLFYVMHYPVWNLSALRQGIAMAIMFYFLFNNSKEFSSKIKVASVVVAILFHYASIIVPILYILSKFEWKKKWFIYLLLLVPVFRFILRPEILIYFESIPFVGKYTRYLLGNQVSLLGFTSLVRLFFFFAMYVYYDLLVDKYPDYKKFFNFVTLSFIMYLFLPFSTVIATRLTVYGYFLTVIVFPMIVDLYKDRKLLSFNVRKVFITGLSVFSLLSFYNEFDKMRDRSGYVGSLTELNTMTIFNGTYNDFNKQFALMLQIREFSENNLIDNELINKSNTLDPKIETTFKDGDTYSLAYLPKLKQQVIINDNGEIFEVIDAEKRVAIIGNVKENKHSGKNYTSFSYFTNLSDKQKVDDEVLNGIIIENALKDTERLRNVFTMSSFDINNLKDNKIISEYNMLPVESSYLYSDSLGSEFKYLEISSTFENYYALLSKDGEVLIDKWYNSLSVQNNNGIVIGYTTFSKEYINSDGEIIWIESLNK